MSLHSMTGFGRAQGRAGAWTWVWEVRSVNSKGLDLRLRTPLGFDALDVAARAEIAGRLKRGACSATLSAQRDAGATEARINRPLLNSIIAALAETPLNANLRPASLDGLIALKGVVDYGDAQDDEAAAAARDRVMLDGLGTALSGLVASRRAEGAALAGILDGRIDRIAELTRAAEAAPGRSPEAVRARLARAIEQLAGAPQLDPARLHQEAILIAAKADVREELDRLAAHAVAARKLLREGGPIGRRLDFLAQEFGRESNTLCAKSNDAELTAIGLELKVEIEQFREQVQNVE